jgi:hypothetical protein
MIFYRGRFTEREKGKSVVCVHSLALILALAAGSSPFDTEDRTIEHGGKHEQQHVQ